MAVRKILTVSLSPQNFQFLENIAKEKGFPKSSFIEKALDYYRRFNLRKNLMEGFKNQTPADRDEAMSDFADYLKMVES